MNVYLKCLQTSFCTLDLRTAIKLGAFGMRWDTAEIDLKCIHKEESASQILLLPLFSI